MDWNEIENESVELFRGLLRLDTTNPPGNEVLATDYLAETLRADGLEPWVVQSAPGRANLVVRLPATTKAPKPPLLLTGHTDVVPARGEDWQHDPFAAELADGCIWGRGAVDMKNMVSMSVMVAKLLARHDVERDRDVIVACVADEEEGCAFGSRFLVEEHPDRVRSEYALGEVGGFWLNIGKVTYMPIMTAEKGRVEGRLRARGTAGHAAMPRRDNPIVRLGRAVERLGSQHMPYHLTDTMAGFLDTLARTQGLPEKLVLGRLKDRRLADLVIDKVLPESQSKSFGALLHNTVSPTIMHVGEKRNVIPSEATCEFDGRVLPGFTTAEFLQQMRDVIDDDAVEIEVISETPSVEMRDPESPMLRTITNVVGRYAPEVVVTPYQIPGYTDGQYFSRLGTKFYGCAPLMLPPDSGIVFSDMFHGVDERVPEIGYRWGQRVLFDIVREFLKP